MVKFILNLCRIAKCAPPQEALELQVKSSLLKNILQFPDIAQDVDHFLDSMSQSAAAEGKKSELFLECNRFPEVEKYQKVANKNINGPLKFSLSHI